MKPTLVIYGNCQAGVLGEATKFIPEIHDNFEVVYYRSFDHPTEGKQAFDPEVMARCRYFWCQVDNAVGSPFDGDTPVDMKKVVFPSVDLGMLWPFQTPDPMFTTEPDYPFGMFPYGDRLLIKLAEANVPPDQVIERFGKLWADQRFNFERYLDIEMHRLIKREQGAHVRMAAWVLSHFRTERLLWAYNHPTNVTFRALLNRLMAATFPEASDPAHALYNVGDRIFESWDPFSVSHQPPVHAQVAHALDLTWWSPDYLYYFHDGGLISTHDFVEKYVTERIKRQG